MASSRAVSAFLERVKTWAARRDDILGIAIVGSHARGTARPDSDIDLVLLTQDIGPYLADDQWLADFGQIDRREDEDWGAVQSRRVFYAGGLEVEFGLTTAQWAAIDPVDAGTHEVIADGVAILADPHGLLYDLIDAIEKM